MAASLAIRGATHFDGSGGERREGMDLLVEGDRIAAVGRNLSIPADAEVVEADGLALMPGIIDSHTHYDAQITWDPTVTPSPEMGVSTCVIGNCGFTIAPCRPADRELVMRNLTQVEGMSLDALKSGIRWDFESFPEYLAAVERPGLATNVAAFLGHSALRTYVMGEAAVERAASDEEIAVMAEAVRQAMGAGALGFATSTAPQHNGWGGRPMPSRLADDREFKALMAALGESGRGLFMLTKGNRTDVAYLEGLAEVSRRPIMIAALLHNPTRPGRAMEELDRIADANGRGHELWGQVSCCPLTMDFTLASPYPLESLNAWAPAMKAEGEALKRIYCDPAFRQAVRDELEEPPGVRLFNGEWDKLQLTEAALPENRRYEHRSIAESAAAEGRDPLDFLLDLAVAEDLKSLITAQLLNSDEDAVGRMLCHPNASVALSDAGAHLTFFCDAGFGLHLLGHWSRDLGVMSLEQAVRELTAKPAEIFRIPKRGRLAPGHAADLLLFDPATVGRGPKRRVHDLPGGAARLTTDPVGLHGLWVNGQHLVYGNGRLDQAKRPGRLLREFDA